MKKYILKKISYTTILFIIVIFISFFTMKLIPSDPISAMFEQKGPTPEERKVLEKELGLDKPIVVQFTNYLQNIFLKFDFGKSYNGNKESVLKLFKKAFTNTFKLTALSCFFGSLLGITLGVLSAFYIGTKKSFFLDFLAIIIVSMPTFVIGFLLQINLGYYSNLLPVSGFETTKEMVLPILTLSLTISGSIFKITQTTMLECLKQPYITVAHAKGLSKTTIIFKHALKNALIPILSHIGIIFSFLIGGAIITEHIFNIKGIGSLMITSFEERDFPIIQCCIILLALFISIWNLFLELIYFWLDPKINIKG
ncbi:ABC transporter permease [Candidatus Phytoplasma fraxini]|uniref:Oligopeptide ABC transporter, permease protein 1 (OppB) n=1 Tax=Ash yellows phytoplasma TaxID=35780 RepID=A0ABZ2U8L0_ASHYP